MRNNKSWISLAITGVLCYLYVKYNIIHCEMGSSADSTEYSSYLEHLKNLAHQEELKSLETKKVLHQSFYDLIRETSFINYLKTKGLYTNSFYTKILCHKDFINSFLDCN